MSETREERLKRLQDEYEAIQKEIAAERSQEDPVKMRDTLYQLLYSSVIRHGVTEAAPGMVIQVPNMQPDPGHIITWTLADDKKSIFIRIINRPAPPKEEGGIRIEKPKDIDMDAELAREEVMA